MSPEGFPIIKSIDFFPVAVRINLRKEANYKLFEENENWSIFLTSIQFTYKFSTLILTSKNQGEKIGTAKK